MLPTRIPFWPCDSLFGFGTRVDFPTRSMKSRSNFGAKINLRTRHMPHRLMCVVATALGKGGNILIERSIENFPFLRISWFKHSVKTPSRQRWTVRLCSRHCWRNIKSLSNTLHQSAYVTGRVTEWLMKHPSVATLQKQLLQNVELMDETYFSPHFAAG